MSETDAGVVTPLTLPKGLPPWVYAVGIIVPLLIGGGSGLGISFISAGDVNDKLDTHIAEQVETNKAVIGQLNETDDSLDNLKLNIMLLCKAQEVDCID